MDARKRSGAPIRRADAEPENDHANGLPDPSQTHRRAPLQAPSPTGTLKNLGIQNGDKVHSPAAHLYNGRGRSDQTVKSPVISTNSRDKPLHIDLNFDSYSYSRDAVGRSLERSDIRSYAAKRSSLSPDEYRRSTGSTILNRVPEEMESGAIVPEHRQEQRSTSTRRPENMPPYYGSVGHGAAPSMGLGGDNISKYLVGNVLNFDEESDLDEDEEDWFVDEELARKGLYRGNYRTLLLLYTFVPITAILAFLLLALLLIFAFPSSSRSPFPYPRYLPFPLPEVCTATALWSLSYLLRDFLYAASLSGISLIPFPTTRFPLFIPVLTSLVSAFLQSAATLFFRQLAVPILLIPFYSTERMGLLQPISAEHHFPTWQDGAFRRVWWVALGWAAAEAVVGIKQGYENISLYKDVLVSVKRMDPKAKMMTTMGSGNVSDEEGQVDVAGGFKDALRSLTPITRRVKEDDPDPTPTNKPLNSPQEAFTGGENVGFAENRNIHPFPLTASSSRGRDHRNSLHSLSSNSQFEATSSAVLGERQPLLHLTVDTNQPPRGPTPESERLLVENAIERDLDQLMALKNREELEEVYGIPVINIPVFISCLHRINAILSSLGITLFLTAAYMRSTFAYHSSPDPLTFASVPVRGGLSSILIAHHPMSPSNRTLLCTLPPILVAQTVLAMMHTPWILPRIGIHTFVYINLIVSLGYFFGGLGLWEALT